MRDDRGVELSRSVRKLTWVMAVLLAVLIHSSICAAQRTPKPAGQTAAPGAPATATTAPSATKPVFDPGILAALGKNWQKPDLRAAESELNNAEKDMDAKRLAVSGALTKLEMTLAVCSQFKYSADDQKKAGCTGNDTVSQCTQKLFAECTKANREDYAGKRARLVPSVARLEKALKEYSAALGPAPTANVPKLGGTAIVP